MINCNLYNKAQLQWQVGDWKKLSQYNQSDLEGQDEKAQMAVMVAVACLQLGNTQNAKLAINWAQDWGVSKQLLAEYLLSGIQNTLGLAHLINQSDALTVNEHFKNALVLGCEDTDLEIALKARICSQKDFTQIKSNKGFTPTIKTKHQIDLGDAWAGNTVNTVIFRHHGLLTLESFQYTAFYVDKNTLRLVQRNLADNQIITYNLLGEYNLKDAHNSISIGADRQGHLHISYDHHGTRLKYRRSESPQDIANWSEELPMTGKNEEKVTYPTFILPATNSPLLVFYRDGNWKQGTAYLKSYDEELKTWIDYPTPILSGSEQKPWTSNAYWNHPVTGADGSLHLSYSWRTDYFSEERLISNINIDYAQSYDHGFHWFTSKNQPYQLPITQVNSETVWPISPGSNHMNQTSMALDSKGYPHIVFYANDEYDIPQYQHVWFNGQKWQQSYASSRQEAFTLSGGGTLQIPISRPDIVIDQQDNVYLIHQGKETLHKMTATYLPAPDYQYDEKNTLILHEEEVGFAEPVIDRIRWQKEQVLSLLIQYNEQPNADLEHKKIVKPISIIDVEFGTQ